mgnify:CR=1 FL=1
MNYLSNPHLERFFNKTLYFHGSDQFEISSKAKIKKFLSFPYPVSYKINSRGFRDKDWPLDTSNVIWCLGDSATFGFGSPLEHTWSSILQLKSKRRCLNLGVEGASNILLSKMAKQIIDNHAPKVMVIMWSFFHRRHKDPWEFIHFAGGSFDEDLQVFNQCYEEVNYFNTKCNIINLLIPTQSPDNFNSPIFHTSQVDFARDAYHFDYKTAEIYVEHILSKIS